jgi:gamma-tubulin complex component 2
VIGLQASSSSSARSNKNNNNVVVTTGNERYLGIQALSLTTTTSSSSAGNGDSTSKLVFAVGLYRSLLHKKANQWQVLNASDLNQPVPVGPGAQHYHEQQQDKNNNSTIIFPSEPAKLVRSGDAIMLRNVVCGGILSISSHDDGLVVYTDSYNPHEMMHGNSLLTRLERHNVFYPTPREVFHFLLATIPPTAPIWVMGGPLDRRPFLDGTYLLDPHRHDNMMDHHHHHHDGNDAHADNFRFNNNSLFLDYSGRMQECGNEQLQTPHGQEIVLVDELIGSFLGLEGTYIRAVDSSLSSWPNKKSSLADLEFQLVDTHQVQFDVGLRSLVEELLAVSTHFCRVNHFTCSRLPGYEYGSVMQALCKTLDEMLQEHCVYIAKLELQFRKTGMTMRRLQVLVRPSLHSMSVLERVTRAVANEKGDALINALRRLQIRVYEGDGAADAIIFKLIESASIPYMSMLQKWLGHGILSDPHAEFVIRCNHEEKTDWEGKYSIVEEHLLEGFFSTNLTVDRVLATGQYWNAVCNCRHGNLNALRLPAVDVLSSKHITPMGQNYRHIFTQCTFGPPKNLFICSWNISIWLER